MIGFYLDIVSAEAYRDCESWFAKRPAKVEMYQTAKRRSIARSSSVISASKSDIDDPVRYCMSPNRRASVNRVNVVDASASREFLHYSQTHPKANSIDTLLGVLLFNDISKDGTIRIDGEEKYDTRM